MSAFAASSPLSASVLVLNRFYVAIHVVTVRRAFRMLFRELVEVVHFEEGQFANYDFESWREISELRISLNDAGESDEWISAVNFQIQVPRVVRLLDYDRIPKETVKFSRRNVFLRDENHCQYCRPRNSPSNSPTMRPLNRPSIFPSRRP